jgi:tetratricopeptide (TPR) repeat protein
LGDYGQAKNYFQQALRIDPSSAATQFELAKLLTEQGQFMEAIQLSQSAYETDPDNVWYAHFLAQLYTETGDFERSVEVYHKIIERQPEEYENYFNLANLLSAQQKFKEALEVYGELEERLGPNEDISVQRQLIYLEKGDLDKALEEVNALIDANPDELRYYGMKAEILQGMKRFEEAKALYEMMLYDSPENGLVLLALFELSEKNGNQEKADEYITRAFGSPELGIDVKVNILLNFLSTSNLRSREAFITDLGAALEKAHPNEAKAYAIQGDIFYNFGRLEEARTKFQRAVEIDPNRPPIWQQILTISSQLNDFVAMKAGAISALELFPMQPIFYLFSGIAHLQMKEMQTAVEALEMGLTITVDNPALQAQLLASLGDTYHEMSEHQKSDRSYDKALELDGSNTVVLNNYAYYLSLRDTALDKAESMAKKANNLSPDTPSFQDTYGWVLHMRGNHRNALFWIEEALKNGAENDPVVLGHYGDVLQALERKADAVRAWQQAIDAGGDAGVFLPKINAGQIGE